MAYRIDPERDRVFIEEFRKAPIGRHSPGLMRVLNAMRFSPSGQRLVLLCRKPFAEWVLARLPDDRSEAIEIEPEPVFTSREEAEWEVFRRRWREYTGQSINLPLAIDDDASGDGGSPAEGSHTC